MPVTEIILAIWLIAPQVIRCGQVRQFPEGFQFGVATAAYQIEGAWNISDKAESIWDRAAHTPGKIIDGSTGDVADDSYHLYERDVEMLRELGVDFYRFSVSWPRLLPNGFANKISEDGKRYYNALIDELLKYNIKPMISLYHCDLPQNLQILGGWTNPYVVDWFEDYARVVFDLFADRVKMWITFNEPLIACALNYDSYNLGSPLLSQSPGVGDLLCSKNVLLAHARVYRLFDEQYRPKHGGIAGLCNQIMWHEPITESAADVQLAEEANQLYTGIYSEAIFSAEGGWPRGIEELIATRSKQQGYPRSRLPAFSQEEKNYVKGTYDFYGLNYYTTKRVRRSDTSDWPMAQEIGADVYSDPKWPSTPSAWFQVYPLGMRRALNFIKERYKSSRILIIENGCSSNTGLQDDQRTQYYKDHLNQVLDAIYLDGINITHYTAWSLMDNFEWNEGYTTRFGLYEVDYSDPGRTRTPRKSALVYKHIVSTRTLDLYYEPQSLNISITEKK